MGTTAVKLVWEGDRLRAAGETEAGRQAAEITPKPENWVRFWSELDRLNVWDWWPSYRRERFGDRRGELVSNHL
jgi:hypothetical protein